METCFNYTDKNKAFFSSDERHWITRIHKLKRIYPDEINIIREPETNDGCIYCSLPSYFLRLQGKANREPLTEEQRRAIAERLHKTHC